MTCLTGGDYLPTRGLCVPELDTSVFRTGEVCAAEAGMITGAGVFIDTGGAVILENRIAKFKVPGKVSFDLLLEKTKRLFLPTGTRSEYLMRFLKKEDPFGTFPEMEILCGHLISNIGRGEGLTPSGDDLFLGFYTACSLFLKRSPFPEGFLSACKEGMSDISKSEFDDIKNGFIPEFMCLYLDFLSAKERPAETMAAIKNYGHLSGEDHIAGFMLFLQNLHIFEKELK